DSRFPIPDSRRPVSEVHVRARVSGFRASGIGPRLPATGSRIFLKDSPEIFPKIDREAPPPISKSTGNIESQNIKYRKSSQPHRGIPPTRLVHPNRIHKRSKRNRSRRSPVAAEFKRRKWRRKTK